MQKRRTKETSNGTRNSKEEGEERERGRQRERERDAPLQATGWR